MIERKVRSPTPMQLARFQLYLLATALCLKTTSPLSFETINDLPCIHTLDD